VPFASPLPALRARLGGASRTTTRVVGVGALAVALVGSTAAYAAFDTTVDLTVDGETTQVRAFGRTVEAVLDAADVSVGSRDLVAPAADSHIEDGAEVVVRHAREVELTVDGATDTFWTTSLSVGEVLAELDVRAEGAWLSASRSTPLGRDGLALQVVTPKTVRVLVDGQALPADSTATSVAGLLAELGVVVNPADRLSVPVDAPLVDGLLVSVTRITMPQLVETVAVEVPVEERESDDLFTGETDVEQEGAAGVRTVVHDTVLADGVEVGRTLVSDTVTTPPVPRIVLKGTKARPVAPAPAPAAPAAPAAPRTPARAAAPAPAPAAPPTTPSSSANGDVWDRLAQCESGGNWSINTGNGYYGGLQFNAATWRAYGGSGLPHENSREQQIAVAENLRADRGFAPWPACSRKLGLR
jgi:uncharacterized protein YabE (DUF348 family)